jgi:hypothetical protein
MLLLVERAMRATSKVTQFALRTLRKRPASVMVVLLLLKAWM